MRFIKDSYSLNVFRKQGAIVLEISCTGDGSKVLHIVENGIDLTIKSKFGKLPMSFTLQKRLPKDILVQTNKDKLGDLGFNLDLRKLTVSGTISGRYVYIEEKARRDSLLNAAKMSALYKDENSTSTSKFINYTHTNVDRPFQGGAVNPR